MLELQNTPNLLAKSWCLVGFPHWIDTFGPFYHAEWLHRLGWGPLRCTALVFPAKKSVFKSAGENPRTRIWVLDSAFLAKCWHFGEKCMRVYIHIICTYVYTYIYIYIRMYYTFIHSFICSFVHSFIHSCMLILSVQWDDTMCVCVYHLRRCKVI